MNQSVLFVCLGNICRSPAAEGVARRMALDMGLGWEFDSAGTAAYHIGEAPDPRMRALCRQKNTPIDDLRARQAVSADFLKFDWIMAMDDANYQDLCSIRPVDATAKLVRMMDFAPELPEKGVPDPYYGGPEGFTRVHLILTTALARFLNQNTGAK